MPDGFKFPPMTVEKTPCWECGRAVVRHIHAERPIICDSCNDSTNKTEESE